MCGLLSGAGAIAFALATPLGAKAQVEFLYNAPIAIPPGEVAPPGQPPWLQVLIDTVGKDTVQMTMTSTLSDPSPFISEVAFRLDPSLFPLLANVNYVPETCRSNEAAICTNFLGNSKNGVKFGVNTQGISGGAQTSGYDLLIDLPPPPGSGSTFLNGGDSISFQLTGTGLYAEAFLPPQQAFLAPTANSGAYYTVAKVQGLPGEPGSTVIAGEPGGDPPIEPETQAPGPLPILGGASAWACSRRLRRRVQRGRDGLPAVRSA